MPPHLGIFEPADVGRYVRRDALQTYQRLDRWIGGENSLHLKDPFTVVNNKQEVVFTLTDPEMIAIATAAIMTHESNDTNIYSSMLQHPEISQELLAMAPQYSLTDITKDLIK